MCHSSTEAEIHAANEACPDVLHAIDLLTEIGHPQKPVVFYEDNQAVISLMLKSDFNYQTKSKHVRVRYNFLKEQVRNNVIVFRYIPTELQVADIFTRERFFYFRDCLLGRTPVKPLPPESVKTYEQDKKASKKTHPTSSPRGVLLLIGIICKCYVCSLRICVDTLFLLLWEKRRILSYP